MEGHPTAIIMAHCCTNKCLHKILNIISPGLNATPWKKTSCKVKNWSWKAARSGECSFHSSVHFVHTRLLLLPRWWWWRRCDGTAGAQQHHFDIMHVFFKKLSLALYHLPVYSFFSSSIFICIPSLSCPWNKWIFSRYVTTSSFVCSICTLKRPITSLQVSSSFFFFFFLLFYIFLKCKTSKELQSECSYFFVWLWSHPLPSYHDHHHFAFSI